MYLVFRWILNALALMGVAYLVPGIAVDSFWAALVAALVLGLVNALLRPILLILTLPVNILTLGLFTLVINGFLLWLVGTMVKGFTVTGLVPALLGALVLWAVSMLTDALLKEAKNS